MPKEKRSKEARARLRIINYLEEKTANTTPTGFERKEYGPHKYAGHDGTLNCQHECGCWMGPSRSGGPIGLDPDGKCPGNPLDNQLLGGHPLGDRPKTPSDGPRPGSIDLQYVVMERIARAESRCYHLTELLVQTNPNINLAEALKREKQKTAQLTARIKRIKDITREP